MKPRARRVTLAAAVLGAGVVAVLVVVHWSTVRDHVEAWHFQLRREAHTFEPDPEWPQFIARDLGEQEADVLTFHNVKFTAVMDVAALPQALANSTVRPVIVDWTEWEHGITMPWGKRDFSTEKVIEAVRERSFRVLEQRFPRRAYVLIRDSSAQVLSRTLFDPNADDRYRGCWERANP